MDTLPGHRNAMGLGAMLPGGCLKFWTRARAGWSWMSPEVMGNLEIRTPVAQQATDAVVGAGGLGQKRALSRGKGRRGEDEKGKGER